MRIASEGYHIIAIGFLLFLAFVLLLVITGQRLFAYPSIAALIFDSFALFFFRDPIRIPSRFENAVLSPADGKIIAIDNRVPSYFKGYKNRLSIFLSMLDVHINRLPIGGHVERVEYHHGKFVPAFSEKASEVNEHTVIEIANSHGSIGFCQRAGTIARRIVCRLKKGDNLQAGEKFGMILFGSRVDIYMPDNVTILAHLGQRIRAGESIIGEFEENES